MYNLIEYSSNCSETTGIYGFIRKMKQPTLIMILKTLIIRNILSIRLNYY